MNDPVADLLTRVRNAGRAEHSEVVVPASKMKVSIADILKEEGFIQGYELKEISKAKKEIHIKLKYYKNAPVIEGLKKISKGSCRVYVNSKEIPRVRGGLGIAVLTTNKGLMTGKKARQKNLGGEVLFYVW